MKRAPAVAYFEGWRHTRPGCDRPTPRPGAELLRASLCHLCGVPVEAEPSPSPYWRCDLCTAPIVDRDRHTAAHLRHRGPAPTYT